MDFAIILLSMCIGFSLAYPGGPPARTCASMKPNHGYEAQNKTSNPYIIEVSKYCFSEGDSIDVTIRSANDQVMLRGFFVQAHNSAFANTSFGTFIANDIEQRELFCFGGHNNAIAHIGNSDKYQTRFKWRAGVETHDIRITATIVQTKAVFWTGVTSNVLFHYSSCVSPKPTISWSAAAPQVYSVPVIVLAVIVAKLY